MDKVTFLPELNQRMAFCCTNGLSVTHRMLTACWQLTMTASDCKIIATDVNAGRVCPPYERTWIIK